MERDWRPGLKLTLSPHLRARPARGCKVLFGFGHKGMIIGILKPRINSQEKEVLAEFLRFKVESAKL